jgi:hypothetical protein
MSNLSTFIAMRLIAATTAVLFLMAGSFKHLKHFLSAKNHYRKIDGPVSSTAK